MAGIGDGFLLKAIHSEIIARDAYKDLSNRINDDSGKRTMLALSSDEEGHRTMLAARFKKLFGKEYDFDPDMDAGPDFSFINKSTFGRTDAEEVLRLAIGSEIDAVKYYSSELDQEIDSGDRKMLKTLIKIETGHKKKLERELKRLTKTNHWNM